MRARATRYRSISDYIQKVRKWDFSKMIRVRNEKQVSEVQKKWLANVRNLILPHKMTKPFNFKLRAHGSEAYFFIGKTEGCAKKSSLCLVEVKIEKQVFELRKKWKTNVENLDLSKKKTIFLKEWLRQRRFCSGYNRKICKIKSLSSWSQLNLTNKYLKNERSEKFTFEILFWVKKWQLKFFKKCAFALHEIKLFSAISKACENYIFSIGQSQKWKTSLWSTKKVNS